MRAALGRTRFLGVSAAALMVVAGVTACSDDSGRDKGEGEGEVDALVGIDDFQDWETCEVFDNLEPLVEKLGIEHFYDDDFNESDVPISSVPGQGFDQSSAACSSEVFFGSITFEAVGEELDRNQSEEEGRVEVAVSPWNDADEARDWYLSSLEDGENYFDAFPASGDYDRFDIEGDWDEGEFFTQTHFGGMHSAYLRTSNLQFRIEVKYSEDYGPIGYEELTEIGVELEGDIDDYRTHDFEPAEIEEWLLETYIPEVHDIVMQQVGEGAN